MNELIRRNNSTLLSSLVSGPISYRLGNQRRLKYAPPPDLTSNTSKQYSAPVTQPLLAPHNPVATPNIFNPNEPVGTIPTYQPVETSITTNSPSLQRSTPEYLSQANSLQESFRSSPVAISGVAYNSTGTSRSVTPQNQNSNLGVPATSSPAQPIPHQVAEPTTPQNTPANVNYFGYDSYGGQRDFPSRAIENSEKGAAAGKNRTEPALQIPKESAVKSGVEPKPTVTFAPVSAVQVTEKLEHLLAEREEDPSRLPGETKIDDVNVTECQRSVANYDDAKLTGVEEQNDLSKPDDLSSNVFSRKEGSEITHSTIITCQEANAQQQGKFNGTQSHGVSSNVRSAQQQYYQPQPFASSAGFFAEVPDHRRSNLTYVQPATEASASANYTDPSRTVTQPASSFFNRPESNVSSFPVFQYKESTANARELDVATSRNDSQQGVAAVCSPIDPNPQVSRSSWDNPNQISETVIATCNAAAQSAQQPLFYNPAQFQDELPRQIPTHTPTPPATSQHYFDNFTGSTQTSDITSGIGNFEFPTAPSMTVLEPTGSATLNPVQMSINPLSGRAITDGVPPSFQNLVNIYAITIMNLLKRYRSFLYFYFLFYFISFVYLFSLCSFSSCFIFFQAAGSSDKRMHYRGVYHHWFYRKKVEHKVLWVPFSMQDSLRLEGVHNSTEITPETTVATDGGRYDVDILRRQRSPVYWSGESTEVRRCSWFFKGPTESRYVPYDENTACKLEEEYKQACLLNNWNRRIDLNNGEYIIFHSASVQVHYLTAASPELAASWGNSAVNNIFYLIFY